MAEGLSSGVDGGSDELKIPRIPTNEIIHLKSIKFPTILLTKLNVLTTLSLEKATIPPFSAKFRRILK